MNALAHQNRPALPAVVSAWAHERLSHEPECIRALPVSGDSMAPTLNDGDLVFIDTRCNHFAGDGLYMVAFGRTVLIRRLTADFATRCIRAEVDNARYGAPELLHAEALTICGRVCGSLALRGPWEAAA